MTHPVAGGRLAAEAPAVAVASAAVVGALRPTGLPLLAGLVAVVLAFGARRTALLIVGVGLLASALAGRSLAGLRPPPTRAVLATAVLVSDPERQPGGVRAVARLGGRRVELRAGGDAAAELAPALAGERVAVRGTIHRLSTGAASRLVPQHVAAALDAAEARRLGPADPVAALANGFRRTVARGAESLSPPRRALFLGIVLGDDRGQDPAEVEDFRAAGLTHLLAVSGQNVAFALTVASPLLGRLSLRGRLVAGLAVLGFFGALTRWEPSVLRAEAMVAVTLVASAAGRPASTVRVLCLAVAGLVLVDPLLVHSIGFRMSVAACAGLALLTAPLSRRVPLPVAVTLAAQAGVAVVMIPAFGPMPLAAVPANLLAVPAAGPVMMWGLTGGFLAGLLPAPAGRVLHLPTRPLLGWLAAVAQRAAALPLGRMGLAGLAVVAASSVACVLLARIERAPARLVAAVAALVLAGAALAAAVPDHGPLDGAPIGGATVWRRGGAVVVVARNPDGASLLGALRAAGVHAVDVLVVTAPSRSTAGRLAPLRSRMAVRLTLAPPRTPVPGAVAAVPGAAARAGPLTVTITGPGPPLGVRVASARGAAGAG